MCKQHSIIAPTKQTNVRHRSINECLVDGWCLAQRSLALILVASAFWSVGCASTQRCVATLQKKQEAKQAYRMCGGCPLPCEEARHYERGFLQGYLKVAKGRKGCPPVVAPSQYWNYKYESPEGRAVTSLWYQGYVSGAEVARQSGRHLLHRVASVPSGNCCCTTEGVLPTPELAVATQVSFEKSGFAFPAVGSPERVPLESIDAPQERAELVPPGGKEQAPLPFPEPVERGAATSEGATDTSTASVARRLPPIQLVSHQISVLPQK